MLKNLHTASNHKSQRKLLQDWANHFQDRDGKFVKEFQTTFNSSFWELYLHALFREYGFEIDMSRETPDFLISRQNQTVVVEATIANNPEHGTPEWEESVYDALGIGDAPVKTDDYDFTQFNMESIIRFSNSISAKYQKYQKKYKELTHVKGKPFVIALSAFHHPLRGLSADVPIRALLYDYYVDEQELKKHPELYPDGRPPTKYLGEVRKKDGASILLGLFNDECMKEVSAVIFSSLATMGKVDALCAFDSSIPEKCFFSGIRLKNSQVMPFFFEKSQYEESIMDGLQIYHNPYAQYPIRDDFFKADGVAQCMGFMNEAQTFLAYENYDDLLMARNVMRFVEKRSE